MKQLILQIISLSSVCLLISCSMYHKPDTPKPDFPESFKMSVKDMHPGLNDHWWENFNDPVLNSLVEKSLKTNYNYQVALENIDIAQTYVDINMTNLFPIMVADFSLSRNQGIVNVGSGAGSAPQIGSPTNSNTPFNFSLLTATVSYEVDIWNQVHNAVDQAKANKYTAESNTNVTKLTLISTVANTYFQIVALTQDIANLEQQKLAAAEILELTKVQYDSGLIDESGVYQASSQLESIQALLDNNKMQRDILEYAMAYLLGEYPEQFNLSPTFRLDNIQFTALIPAGIPSEVMKARPDIQASLGQILAYGYLEKQNLANFFPSLSLSSTYGFASSALSNLTKGSNALWNFGADVVQLLVNYPALLAQYEQSKIQYKQSILSYRNTVLNAFVEVNSALTSYQQDASIMHSFQVEKNNAQELVKIAKAQYEGGLTNYTDYLSNELTLLQSDYNLTNQQYTVASDIIQTYKALGLGLQSKDQIQ